MTSQGITSGQIAQLSQLAESAARKAAAEAIEKAIKQFGSSKDAVQSIIEGHTGFAAEVSATVVPNIIEVAGRYLVPQDFADEETQSDYGYLSGYQPGLKDLARQIDLIRSQPEYSRINPDRAWKLAQEYQERGLVDGAEKWMASVDPQFHGPEYGNHAVRAAIEILSRSVGGRFTNYLGDNLGPEYLRQVARTAGLESQLREMQGSELWIEMGQFGKLHAGQSVRRARVLFPSRVNEYGGGAFKALTWLLAHPDRLKNFDDLWLDCPGDECSPDADGVFGDAPFVKFYDGDVEPDAGWFGSADGCYGSVSAFAPFGLPQ